MKRIELAAYSIEKNEAINCYHIAQTLVVSDLQSPYLAPFATGDRGQWKDRFAGEGGLLEASGTINYAGPGWIGNRWREVVSQRISIGYRIAIDGIGAFAVASDDQRITQIECSDGCANAIQVEAALGPPLILALALQGKFCLHAGAALSGEKLVAFVGESGYGKSTLARYLGSESGSVRRRVCDDILPVAVDQDSLLALPHFPQLKLPADRQPPLYAPVSVALHTVYVLDKNTPQIENKVDLHSMTRAEATIALVQHTVAARLFDQELLAQHLTFCAEAAARIRVRRLSYPRRFDMLPRVREAIMADLDDRGRLVQLS